MLEDRVLTSAAFAALAGGFLAWGDRPLRFGTFAAAALAGWCAGARALGAPAPTPLAISAFVVWWAGLALAAAMLRRSVSLRALGRLTAGEDAIAAMQEDVSRRVDELVRLGWALPQDDRLVATALGRSIGAATRIVRRVFVEHV